MCRKRIATCLIGVTLLAGLLIFPLAFSSAYLSSDIVESEVSDAIGSEASNVEESVLEVDATIGEDRISQVKRAMGAIAETAWPHDIDKLLTLWKEGYTVDDWAGIILEAADRHGIDPLILVAVIWQEGKFKVKIVGDGGRSCGATQVRTDYKGRPSCQQLLNPALAVDWTAKFLVNYAGCTGNTGHECLRKYNGGGYSKQVWKNVTLMKEAIQ